MDAEYINALADLPMNWRTWEKWPKSNHLTSDMETRLFGRKEQNNKLFLAEQ
jgi:hypothetical protein